MKSTQYSFWIVKKGMLQFRPTPFYFVTFNGGDSVKTAKNPIFHS